MNDKQLELRKEIIGYCNDINSHYEDIEKATEHIGILKDMINKLDAELVEIERVRSEHFKEITRH